MAELRTRPDIASRALELTILTAARSGEVLHADWSEIDLQMRLWTVPAGRMKKEREHRVPLSDASVALLGALPGPHTGLVFSGTKTGRSLHKMAMADTLRAHGRATSAPSMASAAASATGPRDRTEFAREVVEAALAHVVGDRTEAAYRRSDALEKRRKLMDAWSSFCAGKVQPSATVTELRRA